MLQPERTYQFAKEIRERFPDTTLILYIALHHPIVSRLLRVVDGITYTLHRDATVEEVQQLMVFQGDLFNHRQDYPEEFGSYRLAIDGGCRDMVPIRMDLWTDIRLKKWLTEEELSEMTEGQGAPVWEDLLIWKGEDL